MRNRNDRGKPHGEVGCNRDGDAGRQATGLTGTVIDKLAVFGIGGGEAQDGQRAIR